MQTVIMEDRNPQINVEAAGNSIKTMLAGDELELFRQTADTLPDLYEQRNAAGPKQMQTVIMEDRNPQINPTKSFCMIY